MYLEEFTEADWNAWAGASKGPNGEEPLIGFTKPNSDWPEKECEALAIVVGGECVQVFGIEAFYNLDATYATGKLIAEQLREPLSVEQLVTWGFTRCDI